MKQITDQVAHFVVAFVIVYLAGAGDPLLCAIAGLGCGLIREWTEERKIRKWGKGSYLDLLAWSLGGLAAGLVF